MSILKKLEDNRAQILLAEIGAYLHLLGRFSKEFIYSNAEDADYSEKAFEYKNICDNDAFFEDTLLNTILKDESWNSLMNDFKNVTTLGELSSNKVNSLSEFIKKHSWPDNPRGLCRILADAHGIVSGIDKALSGRGESGKQRKSYTYRATAFGFEKDIELLKHPELKKEFFSKLKEVLSRINPVIIYEDYFKFKSIIKEDYQKTIGETRRPINEISLYDYAHTIASLTKSNLAKMIVDGWYEPRGVSKWRILKINLDALGLLSKGLKIGDILGYKNELGETFEKIKKIIEFDFPLGNEIYRDSTGIYFSFPNFNNIVDLQGEIFSKLNELNTLEYSLQFEISENSRSMVILSREREESLNQICFPITNNITNLINEFKNSSGLECCPVCRISLKAEIKERCSKCEERYQSRARQWMESSYKTIETIWLDEVADKNDRVALITGNFGINKWLSGELIDTFVSEIFDKWKNENSKLCNQLSIHSFNDLTNFFNNLFNKQSNLNEEQKKLLQSFVGRVPINNFIKDFWEPIAERDATGEALELTHNAEKAKYLVKLLFRKHPSLARIYRIWNTTQEFIRVTIFNKILKNYQWSSNPRRKRVKFKIEPNPNIPEGATCEINLGFSPVCIDKYQNLFITTVNLEILEKFGKTAEEIVKNLNGLDIKFKTEDNKRWKEGKILNVVLAEENFQDYLPFIKIYDFPDQFMILVPAYDAFEIAKRIFEEYEIQFSKVRDRLPFHLGIIAFHRRTPLYIAMESGKRLLNAFKQKTKTLEAHIESIEYCSDDKFGIYAKKLELKFQDKNYSSIPIGWIISYSTGDPEQEDEWHPYIRMADGNPSRAPYSFDYSGDGKYVVHVKALQESDKVLIEPSYFKMVFLESTTDRFRIDENLRPIDDIQRLYELWNNIKKLAREKNLGIAQLYAYWQEVEKRKKDYENDSLEKFVRDSLINILKISPAKEKDLFDKLCNATLDGTFFRAQP